LEKEFLKVGRSVSFAARRALAVKLIIQKVSIYLDDLSDITQLRKDIEALGVDLSSVEFKDSKTIFNSRSHDVQLAIPTIVDNSRYFDDINQMPLTALTIGTGTLMDAHEIMIAATGDKKADAVFWAVDQEPSSEVSASSLQGHKNKNVTFVIDTAAGRKYKDSRARYMDPEAADSGQLVEGQPAEGAMMVADEILNAANRPFNTSDPKEFDIDLPGQEKPFKTVELVKDAIREGLARAAKELDVSEGIMNPQNIIFEIGGSSAYLRDPRDNKLYREGVGDFDIYVYIPESMRQYFLGASFMDTRGAYPILRDAISYKLASINPHVRILPMEGLVKAVPYFLTKPFNPNYYYFGDIRLIKAMEQRANTQKVVYWGQILTNYCDIFEYAFNKERPLPRIKVVKLLLHLALLRGDQQEMHRLFDLIKRYILGDAGLTDDYIDSLINELKKKAEPGFEKSKVTHLVKAYLETQRYGAVKSEDSGQSVDKSRAMTTVWRLLEYFRAMIAEKNAKRRNSEDLAGGNKKIWEMAHNIIMVHMLNRARMLKGLEKILPRFNDRTTLINSDFPLLPVTKDSVPLRSDSGEFTPHSYADSVFIGGNALSCLARSVTDFSKAAFGSGRKEVMVYLLAPYIWTDPDLLTDLDVSILEKSLQKSYGKDSFSYASDYGRFLQESFSVTATVKVLINGKEKSVFVGKEPDHVLIIDIVRANDPRLRVDKARTVESGGIDLTPVRMNLQTKIDSSPLAQRGIGIKFHLDPAMLTQLQNTPGFVPVIIDIEPMTDLKRFLGIQENSPSL